MFNGVRGVIASFNHNWMFRLIQSREPLLVLCHVSSCELRFQNFMISLGFRNFCFYFQNFEILMYTLELVKFSSVPLFSSLFLFLLHTLSSLSSLWLSSRPSLNPTLGHASRSYSQACVSTVLSTAHLGRTLGRCPGRLVGHASQRYSRPCSPALLSAILSAGHLDCAG